MKIWLILCFATLLLGCYSRIPPNQTGLEGQPLPSFNLLLSDNVSYAKVTGVYHNLPVVLFYFSPKCPYCRAQTKEIISNMPMLKNIQFYFFTAWPIEEMKKYYDKYELNKYSNIVTGSDYSFFFAKYFKTPSVPYTAIYGRDGTLKQTFIGKLSARQIREVSNY